MEKHKVIISKWSLIFLVQLIPQRSFQSFYQQVYNQMNSFNTFWLINSIRFALNVFLFLLHLIFSFSILSQVTEFLLWSFQFPGGGGVGRLMFCCWSNFKCLLWITCRPMFSGCLLNTCILGNIFFKFGSPCKI